MRQENATLFAPPADPSAPAESEVVLRILAAATFLIFFQAYIVAPLIPALKLQFNASDRLLGLLVPAYMLPYGFSTLFYGPLSDRIGRRRVVLTMLAALSLAIGAAATSRSAGQLVAWRLAAGLASGGIVPISLALLGDLFPYHQRGRPLGWIFGAAAGGMAFGSTFGALLNPLAGWRSVLLATAIAYAVVFGFAVIHRAALEGEHARRAPTLTQILNDYVALLAHRRGGRGYLYIFLNGVFHSGIFSWLGLYFWQRYQLGDYGIGLALIGYGVPGMLLGPAIGHAADRLGRNRLIPLGLLIGALAAAALVPRTPLLFAGVAVTVLSLGYDMSHPLLAGIITSLDASRRGQAMGLNAFCLFTGFGLGSLVFQWLFQRFGFAAALGLFATVQFALALIGGRWFRTEKAGRQPA